MTHNFRLTLLMLFEVAIVAFALVLFAPPGCAAVHHSAPERTILHQSASQL